MIAKNESSRNVDVVNRMTMVICDNPVLYRIPTMPLCERRASPIKAFGVSVIPAKFFETRRQRVSIMRTLKVDSHYADVIDTWLTSSRKLREASRQEFS
jgi:hypothetical protein